MSLNQFVLWSVAEKVGALKQTPGDPQFPGITYRRGASAIPTPVLRGTGIRVETIAGALSAWEMTPSQIAQQYGLPVSSVHEALAFYNAHRGEIDALSAAERASAPAGG